MSEWATTEQAGMATAGASTGLDRGGSPTSGRSVFKLDPLDELILECMRSPGSCDLVGLDVEFARARVVMPENW